KRGAEQIFLRAQRNLDEHVLNDHAVDIARDERESVHGSRFHTVDHNDTFTVKGIQTTTVNGDSNVTAGGKRSVSVGGNTVVNITGMEQRSVGGSAFLTTKGSYQLTINGDWSSVVGTQARPAQEYISVWGESTKFASKTIRIQSEASVLLECGESSITL